MATKPIPELTQKDKDRFWSRVNKDGPVVAKELGQCWGWKAFINPQGYGVFSIKSVPLLAHRVSWVIENGILKDPSSFVLHRCDNPPCCNPTHLFLGTQFENMQDMAKKGRDRAHTRPDTIRRGENHPARKSTAYFTRGEKCWKAKFSEADIIAIRSSTETGYALAKKYGVADSAIYGIRTRRTWKHVP